MSSTLNLILLNAIIVGLIIFVFLLLYVEERFRKNNIDNDLEKLHSKQKGLCRWDPELAKRFVSDYNFPINNVSVQEIFVHQLILFEKNFETMTKWLNLWKLIDEKFDGDSGKFLHEYYQIRDKIIVDALNNPAYKQFNEMDMSAFKVPKLSVSKNNIYNMDNDEKYFISVDLRKANFQALKYVNPEIVKNAKTYEDFIGLYTDLDYIKTSKYTRQVVFGKLNPSRQVTVEHYLINKVFESICNFEHFDKEHLVSMSNDELVFVVDNKEILDNISEETIIEHISKTTDINVHIEKFQLKGYQLVNYRNCVCTSFYRKIHFSDENDITLTCVPGTFHPIIWRLFTGQKLDKFDKFINYDKSTLCMIVDNLKIVPFSYKAIKFD